MRSTALAPVIVALLALAADPPRAMAQGYVAAPAPTYYARPRTYYVQPQPRYYYAPPQRRGLLRVRKYPVSNTTYSNTILVDPNNRHWTFDYDDWMAHNF